MNFEAGLLTPKLQRHSASVDTKKGICSTARTMAVVETVDVHELVVEAFAVFDGLGDSTGDLRTHSIQAVKTRKAR